MALGITQASAQNYHVVPGIHKVTHVDTIYICKAEVKGKTESITCGPTIVPKQLGFKPVPLAGERSYYGENTEYVNAYVKKYLLAHNRQLFVVNGRGKKHFSLIDNVLKKHKIPKELKYLAVIESALNNRAVSPVGAVGPWQFMEGTARNMGLTVNGKRDDRQDWYKSTNAAAKYLTQLYRQMDDWLLVVAAYNSGPVPVQRAITRTGSRDFWKIKKYLPRETQGHVLAFIATATIFENLHKFIGIGVLPAGFTIGGPLPTATPPPPPRFTTEELQRMAIVHIKEPLSLDLLAQDLNINRGLLDEWNDDYELFLYDNYPEPVYRLRIPKESLDKFLDRREFLTKKSQDIFSEMLM